MITRISSYIVILNWNGFSDTKECLLSINNCTHDLSDINVVVVDNGSRDKELINLKNFINTKKNHSFPIALLENGHNYGFAEGNNVGISYARDHHADLVIVLNNDTIVDAGFVDAFVKASQEYSKVGAFSPKIYFAKGYEFHKERYKASDLGRVIWSAGGGIDWNNVYGVNNGVDAVDNGQFNEVKKVDFASGACVCFRMKALNDVGEFDSKYFLYLEDTDLCMRLKECDWEVLYIPTSIIWHKVSQSSAIGGHLNDYFITRNRLLFGMTYASIRAKISLIRESIRFLINGRKWQRTGVVDYYLGKFGKGSWT
jgi:GT2 family glycosyltransferase